MAEPSESAEPKVEEEITEKIDSRDSPPSSDSAADRLDSSPSPDEVEGFEMLGREKRSVHQVLGGGKFADVLLWRNKKVSAAVLGGATAIWVVFELIGYHMLTFLCYILMLALAILFLWSNAHTFIHKTPPDVPEVHIREEPFLQVASALRTGINQAFAVLRDIASGRDLRKFLYVVGGIGILSVVGSWFSFLTLLYMVTVLLHTVPYLYEKQEDKIDAFGEKMVSEMKNKYAMFDEKVLRKIRKGPLKVKKKD